VDVTTTSKLEDLPDWSQRVVFYNAQTPPWVEIKVNNHGALISIDSAADADELISWATAARDYLTGRAA
jgi:hypothetical protein